MQHIELSDEEQEILSQVLQHALAALQLEILHTDHSEFKEHLKHCREVIERLHARLPQPLAAAA